MNQVQWDPSNHFLLSYIQPILLNKSLLKALYVSGNIWGHGDITGIKIRQNSRSYKGLALMKGDR
jgi:hypothetical protein